MKLKAAKRSKKHVPQTQTVKGTHGPVLAANKKSYTIIERILLIFI